MSGTISSLNIFNKDNQTIKPMNYSLQNRIYFNTNIVNLPLTFSLCEFNNKQLFKLFSLASFLAKSANVGGFKSSGVVFTMSLVKQVASAIMTAFWNIDFGQSMT